MFAKAHEAVMRTWNKIRIGNKKKIEHKIKNKKKKEN